VDDLWIEIAAGLGVGTGMGLVGAGGAIFTVPVFGVVLGHPAKSAFLEALAVTGTVAASSGAWSALRGRVDWQRVVIFGGAGIVGSQLAAPVAVRMDPRLQMLLFTAVAFVAAYRMWGSSAGAASPPRTAVRAHGIPWKSVGWGTVIGALTSLIGVGGGFILIPTLVLLEGLSMSTAIGTSLVVICINAAAGIFGQWLNGAAEGVPFDVRSTAIVAACGVVGSFAGGALQHRIPQVALRRAFAVLLAACGAWLALRAMA
jgi:uncharacterized membrane protein YfcA